MNTALTQTSKVVPWDIRAYTSILENRVPLKLVLEGGRDAGGGGRGWGCGSVRWGVCSPVKYSTVICITTQSLTTLAFFMIF